MSDELKTRDDSSLVSTSNKVAQRVEKINKTIDDQSKKILDDLDALNEDLTSIMETAMDRVVQSTEPGYTIALARLGELRTEIMKKKIDVLKTLVTDKGIELSAGKKKAGGDISDIMNGLGFGVALGAQISNNQSTQSHTPQIQQSSQPFEIIDVSLSSSDTEEDIKNLMDKNK